MMTSNEKQLSQIISDYQSGKIAPIYLLTGAENYFIDQLEDFFENNVVMEENRDFDQTVLYGRDVTMADVVGAAQRYPMMSDRQLVLVREAQDIPTKNDAWEILIKYLEHPQPQTVLVLSHRHKALAKNTRVYKAIAKSGVVLDSAEMKETEVPEWIGRYVMRNGYEVTEKVANLIPEYVGRDLDKISNELSKIFVAEPKGTMIGEAIMEKYIGISKDYNVDELRSAIFRRDIEKCNRIVNNFAANTKQNPIQMVIPMLYAYIVKLMAYIQDPANTKVFPYADYQAGVKNYTLNKLASCVRYLYEADLKSKGVKNAGTISDGEILKETIFKIIH